jgi:cytochrome d ubiquinol oxidase subunit I
MEAFFLSRIQFGSTAAFHILWPIMSIGLSLFMLVMETMWLKTKKESYYRQLRFWTKIFILTFAIGTASGIPLQFQFGTNWSAFSAAAGDFFGNILGFESTVAFALEAAFLGIFVFGWNRVSPFMHWFSNLMIFVGATLSAFWIMAANSWMQTPAGIVFENGKVVVVDYVAAVFNPGTMVSFFHMWTACIEATLFMMAGISALVLIRRARSSADGVDAKSTFFLDTFKYCLAIALFITPFQVLVGDLSGRTIAKYQPAKLAATELHWETNSPGEGADWTLVAVPAPGGGSNTWSIVVPNGLSLLTTHSFTGTVPGLNSFRADARPTVANDVFVFWSFRIMVAIGMFLVALTLLGCRFWYKGKLTLQNVRTHKWFWRLWVFAIPLGFIATEAGWMVREIGRQPWVLYNILRTSEGISSNLDATVVFITTILFSLVYVIFGLLFIYFVYRIVKKGPDLESAII